MALRGLLTLALGLLAASPARAASSSIVPTKNYIDTISGYIELSTCAEGVLSTVVRAQQSGCGDNQALTSYTCFCTDSSSYFRLMISTEVTNSCGSAGSEQATSAVEIFDSYCALGVEHGLSTTCKPHCFSAKLRPCMLTMITSFCAIRNGNCLASCWRNIDAGHLHDLGGVCHRDICQLFQFRFVGQHADHGYRCRRRSASRRHWARARWIPVLPQARLYEGTAAAIAHGLTSSRTERPVGEELSATGIVASKRARTALPNTRIPRIGRECQA